ncbi:hypothetical protein PX699_17255 [Sphingobium sp. H39-3-25]|uniref:hypothetical protein n=1 Tax=Sphingobium arseniciresistens TaxID=3030834 RepID=UPI0023BA0222|nr:hypothetical protein [Sphingobium arseniciresistens]
MTRENDCAYYQMRNAQELRASEGAADNLIKRLHWEMAQRYAFLAKEKEGASVGDKPNVRP